MLEWAKCLLARVPVHDLATLVTRRHDALRAQAGEAHDGKVDGVHQARVASRRLREVVPVLGRGLDDVRLKPLRRGLRDLTRALGPVRELDVALGDGRGVAVRGTGCRAPRRGLAGPSRAPAPGPGTRAPQGARTRSAARSRSRARGVCLRSRRVRRRILAGGADPAARRHAHRTCAITSSERARPITPSRCTRFASPSRSCATCWRSRQRPASRAWRGRCGRLKAAQDSLGLLHDLDVL